MYYIFKLSDSWTLYDTVKQISRPLEKSEIECLKNLLPGLLADNKILQAVEINDIPPNKLTRLSLVDKSSVIKKPETPTKVN